MDSGAGGLSGAEGLSEGFDNCPAFLFAFLASRATCARSFLAFSPMVEDKEQQESPLKSPSYIYVNMLINYSIFESGIHNLYHPANTR